MSNVVKFELLRAESIQDSGSDAAANAGDAQAAGASEAGASSKTSATSPAVVNDAIPPQPVIEVATPGPIVEEHVRVERAVPQPEATPLGNFLKFLFLTLTSSLALAWFMVKSLCLYAVRHPLHVLLNICMLVLLALVVVTGSEIHSQMILGKISDQTIDKIIAGSRFTRDYDAEEVNRGSTREFLRVGAPFWTQRESVRAILFHARKASLGIEDQAVLLAVADIESGFNPMARASTTTACGLFQFVKRTGEVFGLSQTNCMDPWKNAQAGVAHYVYNYERRVAPAIQDAVGAEKLFRTYELSYYLHHDGPESSNPGNEVKATILGGTQFLFRAYKALKEESESQQRAPTFTEKFGGNFWKALDSVKVFFSDFSFSRLLRLGTDEFHASVAPAMADDVTSVPQSAELLLD